MTDPAFWHMKFEAEEWAVVFASGRAFSCIADGLEKADLFLFDLLVHERPPPSPLRLGTATRSGAIRTMQGYPTIDNDPSNSSIVAAAARGDFSWLDAPRPAEPPPYPETPPEYEQPWAIESGLIEHAVIYEDGGIVTIRAHAVIEADGRYTFTARHENGTDVTIGWATTPGAIVLLRGSPDLDDDAKTAAVLAAARAGDLGPARGHGATGGAG